MPIEDVRAILNELVQHPSVVVVAKIVEVHCVCRTRLVGPSVYRKVSVHMK